MSDISNGGNAPRALLMIAFNFPPDAGSTGRLRTLAFARHLPASGWVPYVIAPAARVYKRVDPDSENDIPAPGRVFRTFALDARKHLSWRGRYPSWLAVPDRWIWWWPSAVIRGWRLVRRHDVRAIWSTYPIATTHLIAWTLARLTGLPWIADFRDPMMADGEPGQRWANRFIERKTLARADRIIFTTPGAMARYAARFPALAETGRLAVVSNGYEDSVISDLAVEQGPPSTDSRLRLVHSGVLYNQGRNPHHFFQAIECLKSAGTIDHTKLEVVLRATGHGEEYQADIDRMGIGDIVRIAGPVPYREALQEQAAADGLLLFQGAEFNAQIPAKVFEYLRIARPVLALIDSEGDTARLLAETGGAVISSMTDAPMIADSLVQFMSDLRSHSFSPVNKKVLEQYSRRACTRRLSLLLDEATKTTEAT